MIMHEITLDGYTAQCAKQPIRLGTADSYGVEALRVMRKGEWVDYDIIIAFHPPKGDAVQIRLESDNVVSVPAEATAVAGTGELTFAGYTDGVRQISVSQIYRVAATAGVSGIAPAEPTPDIVQQILSAASNAEEIAQSVRDDADAGKFNGPQGPKGDTGPQGPVGPQGPKGDTGPAVALDTTLTHEGEAADAKATGDAISAVKERQNILVGSETGNPITVDDAFAAPLCGLTVYGKSTQDGTPTPDAPVPIVSAGDGGSVAMKVTGANELEGTKPGVKSTENGITYTISENGVLITGTATNALSISLHKDTIHRLTRGIYYLTTKGLSPSVMLNFYFIGGFLSDVQNQQVSLTRDVDFSILLQILKGATRNTTVQVSLTRDKTTTYSPYREQLLTLPTPNGLPGIPVASGGNYTDPQGQQWVCDEVDLERGVTVQRVNRLKLDGLSWRYELTPTNKSDTFISNVPASQDGTTRGYSLCQYAVFDGVAYDIEMAESCRCYVWVQSVTLQFKAGSGVNSVVAFSEWLEARPDASIFYCLATPIETPLTPAEIAAYKALTAYAPDTVVQASDGAGVKLDYQRDVNIVIKKLEDAIASMTTT